jgi:hypothetical protein
MTQPSPLESESDVGNVTINGKYLAAIESYVRTLTLGADDFLITPNAEFEALIKLMSKLCGSHLTAENVQSILFRECLRFEIRHQGRTGALDAPENDDLRNALVLQIKAYFESIPRPCTLRIELPQFPEVVGSMTALAPNVKLVSVARLKGANKLADLFRPGASDDSLRNGTCLEITVHGYGDLSANSPATAACLSIAKQCAFILTSFGLCKSAYSQKGAGATFSDGADQPFNDIVIPEAVRVQYGRLKINESKLLMYGWLSGAGAGPGLLLTDPGHPPRNEEEMALALNYLLIDVRRYFESRSNEDFEQIAAAIEWYQDSVGADNDTFAYIAACVGLEAILGSHDEQLDSLSKRLADRYAFLMGKGRSHREELRKSYAKVLKLRGLLVHGKAARLAADERPVLAEAQDMLLRLIWKEVHRIRAESA